MRAFGWTLYSHFQGNWTLVAEWQCDDTSDNGKHHIDQVKSLLGDSGYLCAIVLDTSRPGGPGMNFFMGPDAFHVTWAADDKHRWYYVWFKPNIETIEDANKILQLY